MKTCPVCGLEWPLDDFPRDKSKASGRKSLCRSCDNVKSRAYYEANAARKREYMAARNAELRAVRPTRKCVRCGGEATSSRHFYCDRCRRARRRDKGRQRERERDRRASTERGYGWEHQKVRARVAGIVESGGARCARCGEPIMPGEPWDLGHDDHDRSRYVGPEHRACNRATANRVVAQGSRAW